MVKQSIHSDLDDASVEQIDVHNVRVEVEVEVDPVSEDWVEQVEC